MFMRQQSIEKPSKISYLTQRVHMVTQVFIDGNISTQFGDLAVYHSHTRQTEEYSNIRPRIKSSATLLGFNKKWITYFSTVGFLF